VIVQKLPTKDDPSTTEDEAANVIDTRDAWTPMLAFYGVLDNIPSYADGKYRERTFWMSQVSQDEI
jgi:hypothetical protein